MHRQEDGMALKDSWLTMKDVDLLETCMGRTARVPGRDLQARAGL